MFGDQPIMLGQTSVAKLFGVSQQAISEWIRALRTLEVLKLAEPAVKNIRAARYFYVE
jgi:predicted transcriptional regulator